MDTVEARIRHLASGEAVPVDPVLWQALDDMGLSVESVDDTRVALAEPLELLDEARIRQAMPQGLPHMSALHIHWRVDSTNTWLLDQAGKTGFHGSVCLAEYQLAGRGRRGRTWVSPFGRNIYLSLGWAFPRQRSIAGLSLVAGMVVAGALRDLGLSQVGLKWPNDLLIASQKLGGILVEAAIARESQPVVVGIGINLSLDRRAAAGIEQPYTTVLEHVRLSRNQIVSRLANDLLPAFGLFAEQGFRPFASEWPTFDALEGEQVTILRGREQITGINRGIDNDGNLRLDTDHGIQAYNSGEVSLRPGDAQ